MPGTPASAAYTDEAYAMTKKGQAETALGAGLVFSAIGGLFGTAVLIVVGAGARRVRAEVQLVRVLLAGAAGADLRGLHHVRAAAEGLRVAAARPAGRLRRPRQSGGLSALHVRQHRADGRHRHDPADDRHVRDLGDHPLRGRHRPAAQDRRPADRQRVQGHVGADEEVPAADPARQRARHAGRRAAGRGRRHRGVDVLRDQQEVLEGAGEVRHRPRRGHRRDRARPTTARWPARGSRRWCSAFPATRSPRS